MKKIILPFIIVMFFCGISLADEIQFIILNTGGSNTLLRGSGSIAIKVGEKLYNSDKIKVGKKSYLNLVYKDGKTLELKTAGSYTTSKLATMVNSKKNSSAKKFSNFVLAEFVKSVDDLGNMKVTGSVERIIKASIDYCTPPNTNVADAVVTFSWFAASGKSYGFRLTDFTGKVLYTSDIQDTTITLNLQQVNLARGNSYKWFVKDNKKEKALTDTCRFFLLPQVSADSIKKASDKLLKDMDKFDHSIRQILLASFYSDNKLYIDMLQAYERAIALSPDNDTYKKLYVIALNKAGLNRMANSFKNQLK